MNDNAGLYPEYTLHTTQNTQKQNHTEYIESQSICKKKKTEIDRKNIIPGVSWDAIQVWM